MLKDMVCCLIFLVSLVGFFSIAGIGDIETAINLVYLQSYALVIVGIFTFIDWVEKTYDSKKSVYGEVKNEE